MFPKLIDTGGFFLPTYGVFVAVAFLVAIWLTGRLAAKAGFQADKITNLAIYCALAGMAGAKLLMFLFDWRTYWENPGEIFTFSTLQAAGVYQGGLIIAILFAVYYMKRVALPVLATCDVFAPGLAIGHAIGRLGCLAAGCCWGSVCTRPWAITFTSQDAHELTGVPLGVPLHPAQIYESIAEFVIFWVLYRFFHRPHADGQIIGGYLLLYSGARFIVEFFRNHEQGLVAGLSLTQWISLGTFIAGAWLITRARRVVVPATP
jgi:phosphatidylglycerol:prolipoprotein diacylglycerol transferase